MFSQIPATPSHPTPEIEAEIKHDNPDIDRATLERIVNNELDWFMEGLKKDAAMRKRLDDAKRTDEKNWKEHERILREEE